MQRTVSAGVAVLFTMSQAITFSQGAAPPKVATDITAAEIETVLKSPQGGGDRQIKVVDIGPYNVSVAVLHRGPTRPGGPVGGINHTQVTEVYYVLSGSGTLVTGGSVADVKPVAADSEIVKVAVGPSNNATFRQPAQTRKVGPGDVVIIPPGVFHGFSEVPDHVDYLSVRPDPGHVLPAGYVSPLIRK